MRGGVVQPKYYTPQEVAVLLGVHMNTVYKRIDGGVWRVLRDGGVIRIERKSVDEYLAQRTSGGH